MRLITILSISAVSAGCQNPYKKLPEEVVLENQQQKQDSSKVAKGLNFNGANFTLLDVDKNDPEKRTKQWSVSWKNAKLEYSDDQTDIGGTMQTVTGSIYQNDEEIGTYKANNAEVKRGSKILQISGGVKVESKKYDGYIKCDNLTYNSDNGIYEASGNIEASQQGYIFKNPDRLMAYPDFSRIGTPDLFGTKPFAGAKDVFKTKR